MDTLDEEEPTEGYTTSAFYEKLLAEQELLIDLPTDAVPVFKQRLAVYKTRLNKSMKKQGLSLDADELRYVSTTDNPETGMTTLHIALMTKPKSTLPIVNIRKPEEL